MPGHLLTIQRRKWIHVGAKARASDAPPHSQCWLFIFIHGIPGLPLDLSKREIYQNTREMACRHHIFQTWIDKIYWLSPTFFGKISITVFPGLRIPNIWQTFIQRNKFRKKRPGRLPKLCHSHFKIESKTYLTARPSNLPAQFTENWALLLSYRCSFIVSAHFSKLRNFPVQNVVQNVAFGLIPVGELQSTSTHQFLTNNLGNLQWRSTEQRMPLLLSGKTRGDWLTGARLKKILIVAPGTAGQRAVWPRHSMKRMVGYDFVFEKGKLINIYFTEWSSARWISSFNFSFLRDALKLLSSSSIVLRLKNCLLFFSTPLWKFLILLRALHVVFSPRLMPILCKKKVKPEIGKNIRFFDANGS